MIEVPVHLELAKDELPRSYTLLRIGVPDEVGIETIRVPEGDAWKADRGLTWRLGDQWLIEAETACARVPSAILTSTWNLLQNPSHLNAPRVQIVTQALPGVDPRLLRNLRG